MVDETEEPELDLEPENEKATPKHFMDQNQDSSVEDRIQKRVDDVLAKLSGVCILFHDGWWSYRWCHKSEVAQVYN